MTISIESTQSKKDTRKQKKLNKATRKLLRKCYAYKPCTGTQKRVILEIRKKFMKVRLPGDITIYKVLFSQLNLDEDVFYTLSAHSLSDVVELGPEKTSTVKREGALGSLIRASIVPAESSKEEIHQAFTVFKQRMQESNLQDACSSASKWHEDLAVTFINVIWEYNEQSKGVLITKEEAREMGNEAASRFMSNMFGVVSREVPILNQEEIKKDG